jgi:hypothetical protein
MAQHPFAPKEEIALNSASKTKASSLLQWPIFY